jgi:hypothetical protein
MPPLSPRSSLPPDLMPPGFGPIQTTEAVAPHRLRHEENINRQVQLCVYLRSIGEDSSEAVFALRSLCIGLEDEIFQKEWKEFKCHAKKVDGQVVWTPTNTDSAEAFAILMGLLSRWGMTFKKRIVSKTPQLPPRGLAPDLQNVIEDLEGTPAQETKP